MGWVLTGIYLRVIAVLDGAVWVCCLRALDQRV